MSRGADYLDHLITLGLRLGCLIWLLAGVSVAVLALHLVVKFW